MVYTANYTATDVSSIVFQGLGGIGAAIVGFSGLIGLILLYKWASGKIKLK